MRQLIMTGVLTLASVHVLADAGGPAPGKVKVGAAAIELKVNEEAPLGGMIEPIKATGQDGQLRAIATVIQGPPNDTRVAIVAADILAIRRDYLDSAAKEIQQKTGIPFDHILINSTHTHNVPSTVTVHTYDLDREFVAEVQRAIVEAVVQANAKLASSPETEFRFIMGREATVGQNSRIELRDGTISWLRHPTEEQLRPTGPFDSDFPVMVFKRPDQKLTAVIFGHSTHNVPGPHMDHRSAAFYGLAAQAFEQESGAVTTFVEGAQGSSHLYPLESYLRLPLALEAQRRVLNAIRYEVDQAPPMLVSRVGALKREVTVKVRKFDESREEQLVSSYCGKASLCRKAFGDAEADRVIAAFRHGRSELKKHQGEERKTWLSVTRIGDVAIVGVPAELFTQLGMDIKRRSPFRYTFIAGLANDWVGYVGTAEAYRLGGYQMWAGLHSWTERGTGELFVDEAVELLDELYAQ